MQADYKQSFDWNLSRFRNDKDDVLTIISPKQQVKQFKLTLPKAGVEDDFKSITIKSLKTERIDLVNETISFIKLLQIC
jgi:hypothetical protein